MAAVDVVVVMAADIATAVDDNLQSFSLA